MTAVRTWLVLALSAMIFVIVGGAADSCPAHQGSGQAFANDPVFAMAFAASAGDSDRPPPSDSRDERDDRDDSDDDDADDRDSESLVLNESAYNAHPLPFVGTLSMREQPALADRIIAFRLERPPRDS